MSPPVTITNTCSQLLISDQLAKPVISSVTGYDESWMSQSHSVMSCVEHHPFLHIPTVQLINGLNFPSSPPVTRAVRHWCRRSPPLVTLPSCAALGIFDADGSDALLLAMVARPGRLHAVSCLVETCWVGGGVAGKRSRKHFQLMARWGHVHVHSFWKVVCKSHVRSNCCRGPVNAQSAAWTTKRSTHKDVQFVCCDHRAQQGQSKLIGTEEIECQRLKQRINAKGKSKALNARVATYIHLLVHV